MLCVLTGGSLSWVSWGLRGSHRSRKTPASQPAIEVVHPDTYYLYPPPTPSLVYLFFQETLLSIEDTADTAPKLNRQPYDQQQPAPSFALPTAAIHLVWLHSIVGDDSWSMLYNFKPVFLFPLSFCE
jgi:hypothetical protein